MPTRPLTPVLHYLRRIEAEAHERRDTDRNLLARFVRDGDERAFATLLKRHGPLVFGVCRRVLRDRHAAEDAFQATFLLLVRKAASLRQPELLGNWLHGVAYRTALKARSRANRFAADALVGDIPAPAADDALWRDLRPVLDRAIDELPAKYRVPFVLCHLQGLTHRQAAQHLGCPEGTVATRLSRARQRLRTRLARHGLAVAVGAALGIGAGTLSAAPPALLVVSTLRIAAAFRLGPSSAVPATVAALTKGVGTAMLMTQIRLLLTVVALCATLVGGTALWALGAQDPQSAPPVPPTAPVAPVAPAPPLPPVPPGPKVKAFFGAALTGRQTGSSTIRTENFIVEAPSSRIAQVVADAAERLRKSEAIRWLGKELPQWPDPCKIKVSPGTGSAGATAFGFGAGPVLSRNMRLEGTLEQVLCSSLPHEITHTVLADHFRVQIPRWADEGAALQAEDAEEQERHQSLMREYGSLPIPLKKLLPMKDYPPNVMTLYAQGYSLTHFLLQRKDHKTFLAFVRQGMNRNDWDAAVKDHYGFDDVDALQKAWLATVLKTPPAAVDAGIVVNIVIIGNNTIPDERVRREIDTQIGLRYSAERVQKDADRLAATRLFRSVSVRTHTTDDGQVVVIYQVVEHAAPKGPGVAEMVIQAPPLFGRASIDATGRLVLRTPVSRYKQVTRYVARTSDNTVIPTTSFEMQVVEQVANLGLNDVTATDVAGKRIDAKTLAERLKKETAVLFAPGLDGLDPSYLSVIREGTIILTPRNVLPSLAPAAPPARGIPAPAPPESPQR